MPPVFFRILRLITQPDWLNRHLADAWLFAARLMMGYTFYASGMQKLKDWPGTIFLFKDEYKVPLLPPEIAAYLGAGFELGMPVLLLLGLFTRLSVLPLIAMTCVIQFVLGARDMSYNNIEHFYWLTLLLGLLVAGAGRWSVDAGLSKWLGERKE